MSLLHLGQQLTMFSFGPFHFFLMLFDQPFHFALELFQTLFLLVIFSRCFSKFFINDFYHHFEMIGVMPLPPTCGIEGFLLFGDDALHVAQFCSMGFLLVIQFFLQALDSFALHVSDCQVLLVLFLFASQFYHQPFYFPSRAANLCILTCILLLFVVQLLSHVFEFLFQCCASLSKATFILICESGHILFSGGSHLGNPVDGRRIDSQISCTLN
mmetsp:Transcript_4884/g.10714  ORF Transcript_4884/g.10714 Transcript_4884/m.10714 type:complete len:214 (+) Transcript_4884:269-910(+)